MKSNFKISVLAFVAILLFSSCSDDGETFLEEVESITPVPVITEIYDFYGEKVSVSYDEDDNLIEDNLSDEFLLALETGTFTGDRGDYRLWKTAEEADVYDASTTVSGRAPSTKLNLFSSFNFKHKTWTKTIYKGVTHYPPHHIGNSASSYCTPAGARYIFWTSSRFLHQYTNKKSANFASTINNEIRTVEWL